METAWQLDARVEAQVESQVESQAPGAALARFGHALSDPTRARVLLALTDAPGYPAELAELAGTSRQSLSNHLACLRGCGLVVAVPEGRRVRYELADERIRHALRDLLGLVLVTDPGAAQHSAQHDSLHSAQHDSQHSAQHDSQHSGLHDARHDGGHGGSAVHP